MTKKHFIALADVIKRDLAEFPPRTREILVDFCKSQNSQFNRERWLAYIAGECGPNGGEVKKHAEVRS